MAPISPYTTAIRLGRPAPGHVENEVDKQRVTAYWTYDDVYRNVEEAFLLVMRDVEGDEISRRLVPTARTIIEATNRYLAVDPTITPNALATNPDGSEVQVPEETVRAVMKLWDDFASREEFWTKLLSLKRWMLIRGDGVLHLTADDTKPEGSRLRLAEVDPSAYFAIPDDIDPERTMGVYLVTIVDDDDGEPVAQRQSYAKTPEGKIFTQLAFFESDGWDDRFPLGEGDLKPVDVPARFAASPLIAGFELPDVITSIPVYLFRNNRAGGQPYGVSELQGIETLLAGINGTATDQDITMALTGIGVYVTTSGSPKNSAGQEEPWIIAPASVLELGSVEDKFERVKGVDSIQPMIEHSTYLKGEALQTTGTPEVAIGRVDVQVAQSGIALSIQMSPILSKNGEKELEIKGKCDQFLFDFVNMWLPAYEGVNPMGLTLSITFGDPLPTNRKEVLEEILGLVTAKLVSIEYAQKLVQEKLGYDIPAGELARIVGEQNQLLDTAGVRLDEEASGTEF